MVFQIHIPAFPLSQFVESFIYYRDFNPSHSVDRFLPDGNVNVVFDLTEEPKFIYDNDTLKEIQACKRVWFSGIRTNYITIPSGRDSEMFILNFHKGKAYPFVEMPLHALTNYVVDAELVLTNGILEMRESLLAIASIAGKFAYAERHLLAQFGGKLAENPFVDYAVGAILHSPSQLSMEAIAQKVGYSQKHLIQLFKHSVGLTPKAFMKVIRFQKAVMELEQKRNIDWIGLAHECGYFDQAHFIHDFKAFSGFTPAQYMGLMGEFTNYVPVG
jgi:AraC-like DNA-binding protein